MTQSVRILGVWFGMATRTWGKNWEQEADKVGERMGQRKNYAWLFITLKMLFMFMWI